MNLKLDSPIKHVKGVGVKYLQIFKKSGIFTVLDLLLYFPIFYVDFSQTASHIEAGIKKLYVIEINGCVNSRGFRYRRRFSILRISGRVGAESVSIVFFNKPYLEDFFKSNNTAFIYGEFEIKNNSWCSNNPIVFTDSTREPVAPVYAKISTIKSGQLKNIINAALNEMNDDYECLPPSLLEKYAFPGIVSALKDIHFPRIYLPEAVDKVKLRFIYSEFFFFQLELQFIRDFFKRVPRVNRYDIIPDFEKIIEQSMGFKLTADQITACRDITLDLSSDVCMSRLLQGDVGSGKTIVAFISILLGVRNGYQGAFLAPTEILAGQHYSNALKFFTNLKIEILTGSTPAKKRKEILKGLNEGSIDIIFGTHALLTEAVQFKRLGMVIIDEQHRFGVSQRAALYYKGNAVDMLVTTATPIPRTMLLSLYNDLSVSVIKSKPKGRLPIITKIMPPDKRDEFYLKLRKIVEKNEKAYIILPLIEKSDFFAELKDIETESIYFKEMFKGIPIGIVTGRASAAEKDDILEKMADGRIRILIATTVIEVGIDVKDATLIVIENADRYGLSQLHQLRGRVGRSSLQSYCFLFPSTNLTENGKRRLMTIKETEDGFKIAETDLKMRGGGIISGLEQSGFLDFKVGNLRDDYDIFKKAQQDSITVLKDASLQNEYIIHLLDRIREKLKDINFS